MLYILFSLLVLLLGVMLLIALGFWIWLQWKFKVLAGTMQEMADQGESAVPPFRIMLIPQQRITWSNPAAMSAIANMLKKLRYQPIGIFTIPQLREVRLQTWHQPEQQLMATVYEQGEGGPFVDVLRSFTDGMLLKVTSSPETGLDRPPFAPVIHVAEDPSTQPESTRVIHERILAERCDKIPFPVPPESFAMMLAQSYAREMDWRIERGGVTRDELLRVARLGGQEGPDEDTVAMMRGLWRDAIAEFIEQQILETFLANQEKTSDAWRRTVHRLVVVHEYLDLEELLIAMVNTTLKQRHVLHGDPHWQAEFDKEKERLHPAFKSDTIRQAFVAAQDLLPEKAHYEKAGEVDAPWPADLYLAPKQ